MKLLHLGRTTLEYKNILSILQLACDAITPKNVASNVSCSLFVQIFDMV